MEIPYLSLKKITGMHIGEIQRAAADVVDGGWYLQGNRVAAFEEEYAACLRHRHCISTGNGLDALTIMLRGYKELGLLSDGDEVIVSANTFIATILSITENRLTPVLVEPRIDNFQIDDNLICKALTDKTKAVMIVHLYGYNALTDKIISICKRHNLLLLQDCAQSHGLSKLCKQDNACAVRGASAHSFYPGKNLGALADAGAITTDDDDLAMAVRAIANYGSDRKYIFKYKGMNSRMDELTAAILSVKLKYLGQDNRRRQEIAEQYIAGIKNKNIILPPADGVHHVFPVLSRNRNKLQTYLKEHGIQTLIHYPVPPHKQECYKDACYGQTLWKDLSLPITERIHREELSLPVNQAMTDEETHYIIEIVNGFEDTTSLS